MNMSNIQFLIDELRELECDTGKEMVHPACCINAADALEQTQEMNKHLNLRCTAYENGLNKYEIRCKQLEAALKPLAELCLTGVRGEIVFQRDETFIRKCDVILASQLIAGDSGNG